MKFYKAMLFVMAGYLMLAMVVVWLVARFYVLEAGTSEMRMARIVIILPLNIIFILQLLGQIYNVCSGYVITSQSFVLVEYSASDEPFLFLGGMIREFLVWGALIYVFLRILNNIW